MALLINTVLLTVSMFAFSWVYGVVRRNLSRMPMLTATWRDWWERKSQRSIVQRGYDTYSKAAKSFIFGDLYVIPPALFPEVRKLPSTVLHSSAANEDILYLARSLGDDYWDVIPWVRQNVVRSIDGHVSPVRDEISRQFLKHFTPKEGQAWASVPIWSTTFTMMSSIASRFLVGQPLSNDEEFLEMIGNFTRGVDVESVLLRQFPTILRPLIAKFLGSKSRVYFLKEKLRPYVMACLRETEDGKVVLLEHEPYFDEPLLYQFVAYVLTKYSDSAKSPVQMKAKILDEVVGRYLGLFFASIDTTTITFSQILIDLISYPQAQYVDKIRDEIYTVLQAHNGQWNATAISELKHLDSFIRESQRLRPIASALAARKVMPPQGHTFSNGDHFPHGSIIHLPVWYVHTDPSLYPNADQFDGFRFVNDKHPESAPSDIFMAFGYGHHACPGRRFALMLVKAMVVELLMRYEYEELAERPKDFIFGVGILPDLKKEVRIRPLGRN